MGLGRGSPHGLGPGPTVPSGAGAGTEARLPPPAEPLPAALSSVSVVVPPAPPRGAVAMAEPGRAGGSPGPPVQVVRDRRGRAGVSRAGCARCGHGSSGGAGGWPGRALPEGSVLPAPAARRPRRVPVHGLGNESRKIFLQHFLLLLLPICMCIYTHTIYIILCVYILSDNIYDNI